MRVAAHQYFRMPGDIAAQAVTRAKLSRRTTVGFW